MKFDWKNALATVVIAYIGIKLVDRFVVPLLPASARAWLA